jgi:carbonic anhydrase/acetyltransferase-like protein (isoleucine patch superfamily)
MVKNLNTIDRGTKIRLGRWHNDDQADNTIVINASDTPINASNANALYMKPIRSAPSNNTIMTGFDPNTYEILDTGLRRDDIAPREVDYYANIGNTFTSTIKFEDDTSLTTEGVVGIANVQPIHTLDVGTKFYVDENGANVLTVLGDTYVQDDVVIGGNLDVRGTLTSINTENTTIKDAIIELGKGNTSSDIGIIMDRPDTNVVMGYRDTVDEFVIAHTTSSSTSSTITPSSELIDARIHGRLHVNSNLTVDTDTLHVDAIRDRVGINTLTPQTDLDVVGSAHVHSDFNVDTDTLFVDASTDRVGINTLTPSTDFHVEGETYVSGNVTVDTDTFHVDTVNDRVGINTLTPTTDFHVEGDTYVSGNVDVQTNLNVLTDAVVTGNVDVQTDLNIIGNVYATSNIVTTGNVDVQTNLNVATDAIVTGNVDVQTDLNVVGNAYVSSNAVVTGNVDVQSELNVVGNAEIQTDLTVVGNAYVSSNAIVTGNVDVQTDLNVVGNAYVSSNAIVTGNVDVQTDLNVVGNAYLTSNAIITGNADVQTDLNVVGNAYLTSNAIVSGNVDVQTNLNVATDAIVTGNVDVQTDLNVVGNTYLSSNAIVTGNVDVQTNLNVATDAIVTGNVDVQTDLNVVGNAYITSNAVVTGNVDVQTNLNVATDAIVTGNVDVQTDLNIVGNVYASSNIVATGNVDVQQKLNVATDAIVTGNVDVQTDLNIVGDVYASSNIVATGNVDVQQNLNVATDAIVTGNVDVQTDLNVVGNAYLSSNAIVTGNVDVQSDLNVAGDAYVTTYYGDGGLLSNVNLQVVSDHGNTTSSTVQFTNATTGLVTTSNVEVGDRISIGNLTVGKIPIVGTGNFLENSTIGRSNGTIVISSDLEVLGDIIVDGNSYTVESNNLVISDRIIGIANNNVSHELDVGIIMEHPGKNIALIHHGEAQGDEDPHDHTFTIGYTQNTLTDNHIFNDSNLITVEILGNLITQNNLTVSENITVVGTTKLQDSVGIANTAPVHDLDVGSNLYVEDTGSNVLHVTGNVYATRFIGDGAFLENIASNLQQITDNGNVTTNTLQFDGSTALVTTGKVGVSNTAPVHDLDVGSNLYVEDQGSNVLHVTGNVYATRFIGDGAFLENIASNLHEITTNGNVTTNTVQFDGSTALVTTGIVGISNTNPTANLHVTGNAHVSGELEVLRLIDAGQFSRTRIGSGSGGGTQNTQLNQIAIGENSGYTRQGSDAIAIGQEAGHTVQGSDTVAIGHYAGSTDQRPNAIAIGLEAGKTTQGQGSIAIGDSAGELTQNDFSVAIGYHAGSTNQGRMAVAIGTSAGASSQPDNSIMINASGLGLNGTISNAFYVDPIRENSGTSLLTYNPTTKEITQNNTLSNTLTVTNGLITNLGGVAKKTYSHSNVITASTIRDIDIIFDSELFSAKITAHLVEPTSNISVLNLDVTGGTGRDIGKGFLSIVGDQNSKHWDSTVTTTDTTVTLAPSVGLLSDGNVHVFVEYTSPLGAGGVVSIDGTTFDY